MKEGKTQSEQHAHRYQGVIDSLVSGIDLGVESRSSRLKELTIVARHREKTYEYVVTFAKIEK